MLGLKLVDLLGEVGHRPGGVGRLQRGQVDAVEEELVDLFG